MKRLLSSVIVILMLVMLIPAGKTAEAATDYSTVRVKLSVGSPTTMEIGVSGSYFINENGAPVSSKIIVSASGGKLTVQEAATQTIIYTGTVFNLMRVNPNPSAGSLNIYNSSYGWRNYLGHMRFKITSSNTIQVFNHVPLEQYLYGVVGHEMSDAFPLEALKAQTVAARGYAIRAMSSSGDYDLGDTSAYQVYKGYSPSLTNVIAAVNGTKCQVLKYGSEVARTYYAASNGGQTDIPSNVWGSYIAYYKIQDDPYDTRNPSSIADKVFLPAVGYNCTMDSRLNAYLSNKALSYLAQYGVTSASQFTIAGVQSFQLHTPKYAAPSRVYTKANIKLLVNLLTAPPAAPTAAPTVAPTATPSVTPTASAPVSGFSNTQQVSIQFDFTISDLKDSTMPYQIFTNSGLRMYSYETVKNSAGQVIGYNLMNVRYGHGVGMSQRGAQQRAKEGQTYSQILAFYYPGTTLSTVTITEPKMLEIPKTTEPTGATAAPGMIPISGKIGTVINTLVNLRSGPGSTCSVLTTVPKGTIVTINGNNGSWYYVTLPSGMRGYVAGSGLTIKSAAVSTPSPSTTPTSSPTQTQSPSAQTGIVTSYTVNMRSGPSISYAVVAKLSRNTVVTIISQTSNNWYYITVGSKKGYVSGSYIKIQTSTATPTPTSSSVTGYKGVITATSVRLRSGPSTSNGIVGVLPKGTNVTIKGSSNDWYWVSTGGKVGYVLGKYVKVTETPSNTSAAAETGSASLDPNKWYAKIKVTTKLYKSASTSSSVLMSIPQAALAEVISRTADNKFYRVTYNGKTGYILYGTFTLFKETT